MTLPDFAPRWWSLLVAVFALGILAFINAMVDALGFRLWTITNAFLILALNHALHRDGYYTGAEEAILTGEKAAYMRGIEDEREAQHWRWSEAAQKGAATRRAGKGKSP